MNPQHSTPDAPRSPSSTTTAIRALRAAMVGAVVAALVVGVQQDALRDHLAAAYHYDSGADLDDAQSATLTYLFLLATAAVATFAVAAHRVGRSRVRSWATGIAILGVGAAVYNLTQPFPVGIQVAGLLAAALGAFATAVLWRTPASPA